MKVAEWTTDFCKRRQDLLGVLYSCVEHEDYGPGEIVICVLDYDDDDSEIGRVTVSFRDQIIFAEFDYEAVVLGLMKPRNRTTLRIEVHEKESLPESIAE